MNALLLAAALASAELPPCDLPDLSSPPEASAHRVLELGDGRLGVAMEDPIAEPGARLSGRTATEPPGRAPADHVWLWSEASDWLLVPRGWVIRRAAVGVDGSWVIDLVAPAGATGRMRASGMGHCVGCALSAGAPHFERYRAQAAANEFLFCEGYALPITETGRSASWRRFQYTDADGRRVAVEVDIDPDGASYREIAVTRD